MQKNTLQLKDIYLGNIDAKNEVLANNPEEVKRFFSSFVVPPTLILDKFFQRKKYYILGLKGTGKTALLRYISIKSEESGSVYSDFVLFKSDVDEDLKKEFSHIVRTRKVVDDNTGDFDGDDYEMVWRWFFYRRIASLVKEHDGFFQKNKMLSSFLDLVDSDSNDESGKIGLMRLVPRLSKGHIEISRTPSLSAEFDWSKDDKTKVNFNSLVRKADEMFKNLDPGSGWVNIFFDELELNYSTSKQYKRDAKLVRDLIISIEKINSICKSKNFPICLYAAIRSEVLIAVDALGKEINKPISDFGSVVLWNRPGLSSSQQPLLNIIEQRINIARKDAGEIFVAASKIWDEYFPLKINGQDVQQYILHNSWYRPRDVVRLLGTIQEQYPYDHDFSHKGFDAVRKAYSTASWVELTEELKAKYKSREIDGIKYIFYGYKQISYLSELIDRTDEVSQSHKETKDLIDKFGLPAILKDIYRIGIIGNISEKGKMRFSFRGDDEILFDQKIFLHNALRAHLSCFR